MKIYRLLCLILVVVIYGACGMERWEKEPRNLEDGDEEVSTIADSSSSSSNGASSGEDSSVGDSSSSGSYPTTPTSPGVEGSSEPAAEFDWQRVLITEAVTDPQSDHGESTEANGIVFDAFPGTGTVGSSDEYVEIYNGTSEAVDMSLWSLNMKDGTDELQELANEDWETFHSLNGTLQSVGAGEFIVLGNPVGAMNNSITLELLNESGEIVDSVDVENANASDLNDEAYYRLPDGEWGQGWATPGFFLE